MLDYHVIIDLLPTIAYLYFNRQFRDVKLSGVQSSILLGIGLQRKSIDDLEVIYLTYYALIYFNYII
jgi:N-acetyltransferase 10